MLIFVILFLFIFGPDLNFLPLNFVTLFGILSFGIVFFKYRTLANSIILKNLSIFSLIIIIIIYSFVIEIFNSVDLTTNNYSILNLRLIIEGFIPSLLIGIILYKNKFDLIKILNLIVWVSAFQIFFVIIMFNFEIKYYFMNSLMKIPSDSIVFNPIDFFIRVYGLSKNHLSSFPFVQGIICVLSILLYFYTKKISYILLSFIILTTIILNARIGFLPIILLLILLSFIILIRVIILTNFKLNKVRLIFISLFFFILVPIFGISVSYLGKNHEFSSALERTLEAVDSTLTLFDNNKEISGTYAVLLNEHLIIPKNTKDLIFGKGKTELGELNRTDIGYLRLLNYGGIVFSILYYLMFFMIILRIYFLTKKLQKNFIKVFKIFPLILFISFSLAQIKGEFISPAEAMRFVFLYWVILELEIINNYKINNIRKEIS